MVALCVHFRNATNCVGRTGILLLSQILHPLPQTPITAHDAPDIEAVNQPSGDIGGPEKLDGVHRVAPCKDSTASISSTSRCIHSSR